MSVSVSSNKVIEYRLKNGECIHCGIPLFQIVEKGMFKKRKKIPINIPGTVEHGRCLNPPCLRTGNQVQVDPNSGSSIQSKLSSLQGAATAAGTVATVAGAAMTAFGIPGGIAVSTIGSSMMNEGGNQIHGQPNSFGYSSQALLQSMNAATSGTTMLCPNNHTLVVSPYGNTCNMCGVQHLYSFIQFMSGCRACDFDICQTCQTLANYSPTRQQPQLLQNTNFTTRIVCPNGHTLEVSPYGNCDICRAKHGLDTHSAMSGCRACNFDICQTCQTHADSGNLTLACPSNHTLYFRSCASSLICDICWSDVPPYNSCYICVICDWGHCNTDACRNKATQCIQTGTLLKCPQGHIATYPRPASHRCDLCGQDGNVVMGCHTCNWDICRKCRNQAVVGTLSGKCPNNHTLYRAISTQPFSCDVCSKVLDTFKPLYLCKLCDWGTCYDGNCFQPNVSP